MIYLNLSSGVFWASRAPTVGLGDRKDDDCRNKVASLYQPVHFQGYPGHQVLRLAETKKHHQLCFRMEAEPVLPDSQSEGSNVSNEQLLIFVKT